MFANSDGTYMITGRDGQRFTYEGTNVNVHEVKQETEEEEEEEAVSALDLRIGKAAESISLFDERDVLAPSRSNFGPANPRPGQIRLTGSYTNLPYSKQVPQIRKISSVQPGTRSLQEPPRVRRKIFETERVRSEFLLPSSLSSFASRSRLETELSAPQIVTESPRRLYESEIGQLSDYRAPITDDTSRHIRYDCLLPGQSDVRPYHENEEWPTSSRQDRRHPYEATFVPHNDRREIAERFSPANRFAHTEGGVVTPMKHEPPSPTHHFPPSPQPSTSKDAFMHHQSVLQSRGYSSESVEYKSQYLQQVLQRQREAVLGQQLLPYHPDHAHSPEDEDVSDVDRRLRLTEQESEFHDIGPSYSRHYNASPPRSASTLPLNLSTGGGEPKVSEDCRDGPPQSESNRRYAPSPVTMNDERQNAETSPPDVSQRPNPSAGKGKRGRPRKHAPKIPLPPLYVFIRNLLHSNAYNPRVVSWVNEAIGIFKVNNTLDFAQTWGKMKSNRSEEMNYEKLSRAMRYHYGSPTRKGHLAMVKEKRLVYQFGELAVRWKVGEIPQRPCALHELCKNQLCLWTKE